nr:hypothetical protein [Dyella sp. ASV24]
MKPDVSEFSYGYAVTEELVARWRARIVAAPHFPSLYEEGKSGGGYDVKIPVKGIPVFLQFKLSDYLTRSYAKESGLIAVPYYRMHLRPLRHSDQHQLLLDLEATGECVFYIAPEFHRPDELDGHYLSGSVVANSAAFSPSDIGALPDGDDHYVVFRRGSPVGYRCSDEPVEVRRTDLRDGLGKVLRQKGIEPRPFGREGLQLLSKRMLDVIDARSNLGLLIKSPEGVVHVRRLFEERDPLRTVSYLARTFFSSELVVLDSD